MKIKVISDSTCDLTPALVQKYDIELVPLIVVKEDAEFLDNVTISPADIFAHVANGGNLCSTAARSAAVYQEVFAKYADKYDGVFHISLGSGFSSSYQNACIAASEFQNVRVIDSANLTVGQGFIVLKLLELADNAANLDELKAQTEEYIDKVETSFVLDRLDYMVKGGRCSTAAALGANLLNLKPCIDLKDGKMAVGKKYRGHYERCLVNYVKDRLASRDDLDPKTLFLVYTKVEEETLNVVRDAIAQYGNFETIIEAVAGCTISCHCGPGTLGIIFMRK